MFVALSKPGELCDKQLIKAQWATIYGQSNWRRRGRKGNKTSNNENDDFPSLRISFISIDWEDKLNLINQHLKKENS
jgi:hypothetical protein